jgi:hypothetical protein
MSDTERIVKDAEDAYNAVRALNHHTLCGALPAPAVYAVLGNLKLLGLAQALDQLGRGLAESLAAYRVYEDDGSDPAQSVALAGARLAEAAVHAAQLAALLEAAQCAINRQGYRTDRDEP